MRVRGPVRAGDVLSPSGDNDGVAIALRRDDPACALLACDEAMCFNGVGPPAGATRGRPVARPNASRSARRALLPPQVDPGSCYRCGKGNLRAACGSWQEERGPGMRCPKTPSSSQAVALDDSITVENGGIAMVEAAVTPPTMTKDVARQVITMASPFIRTRILGRRTAPFSPFLIPDRAPAWC